MPRSHLASTVEALRERFLEPPTESRPTPLYWWSGGDLDPLRLEWQLDQLAAKGIGGTVVGYSHLPDGGLDHGDPAPLTAPWWSLFRWFVGASAERGMTVGFQDYGIIGGILVRAAERTRGLGAGSLVNETETVSGPAVVTRDAGVGTVVSRRALQGSRVLDAAQDDAGRVTWTVPEGEWLLSTVRRMPGKIGLVETDFDPMHPDSGAAVINLFYSRFATELGDLFGTGFTTFFQDELDLGIVMPMWNSLVHEQLARAGFAPDDAVHSLWHGDTDAVAAFRAAYRDTVVALLEQHYFRPIFEWHEAHSTMVVMDQLSRGDLRLGHDHYADFMQTMAWYHGPGNDDPDLTAPRNIAAFKISSSIAHLHDRPRVTNEAFHSSGWGVTPNLIVGGLNIGFAAGVNQVMLHGLDYTTDGGWWEWASPDFHFRQPWWEHSATLWTYLSRVSELLRAGSAVSDVAILDPTQDLDFDATSEAPEFVRTLLTELTVSGVNADLVPQAYLAESTVSGAELAVLHARYRAVVLPGLHVIRQSALDALSAFVSAGGTVVAAGRLPSRTERAPLTAADTAGWHVVDDVVGALRTLIDLELDASASVMHAHRRTEGTDLHFLVNPAEVAVEIDCGFRTLGRVERWDAWTGTISALDGDVVPDHRGTPRLRTRVRLEPQESVLLCITPGEASAAPSSDAPTATVDLAAAWTASIASAPDNRFGDYVAGGEPLPVATYHVEAAPETQGPWSPALVDHGTRFWALGPVSGTDVPELDRLLPGLSRIDPSTPPLPHAPAWRPYRLSLAEGLEQDPYLLERYTGPHGLKGVSSEFLDPRFLDDPPEPGSVYYFWSTVESQAGPSTLTSRGRCAHTVWVDGVQIVDEPEDPAQFFPPWGLRDMSTTDVVSSVRLGDGRSAVLVKVVVSAEQPSRVAAVVGGARPADPVRTAMLWWQGADPAEVFTVEDDADSGLVWIRAAIPVGATEAVVSTFAELVEAQDATSTAVEGGYRIRLLPSAGRHLVFALRRSSALAPFPDAGALAGPITWATAPAPTELAPWPQLGLRDFSGVVRYEREVVVDRPVQRAELVLEGVEGSVEVTVNGEVAGAAFTPTARVRIDHLLRVGSNRVTVDAANTLVNLYSRLPSPFASMQEPGGGFTAARLEFQGR